MERLPFLRVARLYYVCIIRARDWEENIFSKVIHTSREDARPMRIRWIWDLEGGVVVEEISGGGAVRVPSI
jgi:hypothetical protein